MSATSLTVLQILTEDLKLPQRKAKHLLMAIRGNMNENLNGRLSVFPTRDQVREESRGIKEYVKVGFSDFRVEMNGKFTEFRTDMDKKFMEVRTEMNEKFTEVRTEMNEKFMEFRIEMNEKFTDFKTEINEKFAEVRTDVAVLQNDMVGVKNDITEIKNDISNIKQDIGNVRIEFGLLRADLTKQHLHLLKWSFIFWVGQATVVMGLLFTIIIKIYSK